ncbi:MBL fold metallo-hydrolase [Streptomyces sp. NPDC057460]|uniref:MBL fold metallo-hydrolase n=1 Tax=Streptomyces sp. NPDC057460 TaxID=3346141 RepID=UPI003674DF07
MAEEERLENALARLGVRADDVDPVVNTHLHWDHCSKNDAFPNAEILVHAPSWATPPAVPGVSAGIRDSRRLGTAVRPVHGSGSRPRRRERDRGRAGRPCRHRCGPPSRLLLAAVYFRFGFRAGASAVGQCAVEEG